jgi:hypothetical protein
VASLPNAIPMDQLVDNNGGIDITATGVVLKHRLKTAADREYYRLDFLSVTKLEIHTLSLDKVLSQLKRQKDKLEKLDWTIPYTPGEMQEIELERKFINKKIELLSARQDEVKHFNYSIISTVKILRRSKLFFEQSGINISANFPNTMVFVQNPSYSMAKTSFSKISNINGMDDSIFKAMMSIDEIGLVNISNL